MTALATPEELAGFMQRDLDRYSAEQALASASARVRALTEQTFDLITDDEITIEAHDCGDIYLPQRPVVSVTSVTGRDYLTVEETTLTAGEHYVLIGSRLRLLYSLSSVWPQILTVVYTHGYATIPDDVKDATMEVAAGRYGNPRNAKSEGVGPFTISFDRSQVEPGSALDTVIRRYRTPARPVRLRIP